jgi:hypothetical protein
MGGALLANAEYDGTLTITSSPRSTHAISPAGTIAPLAVLWELTQQQIAMDSALGRSHKLGIDTRASPRLEILRNVYVASREPGH